MAMERWPEVISQLKSLTVQHPKSSDLEVKLAQAYAASGEHRQALAHDERALELGDRNVGVISYAAALSAMKVNEPELALKWLSRLKDIPPMRERARQEPGFASLRDEPRFKEMFGL
jgi:tetratricopeptide (TPR) repeat protein